MTVVLSTVTAPISANHTYGSIMTAKDLKQISSAVCMSTFDGAQAQICKSKIRFVCERGQSHEHNRSFEYARVIV